ncbi:MAG: hypothetical protein JKY94_16240 [Rhodobacteraceae bacterium]|nr:hypothetical protein [Paracoccaceae bacterium]
MDIVLHIGAHRCATTTFQHYMRLNAERLERCGIGFWGPRRTRNGLFSGLAPRSRIATGRNLQRRAAGRVQLHCARSEALGIETLVVSDENMLGSVRANLRIGELYCGVGERVARYAHAFGGRVSKVVLNIRSLEYFWASSLGYGLTRGMGVPVHSSLDRLAYGPRSWRDVVTDVACAAPDAQILVLPFEIFSGQPEVQLSAITRRKTPKSHARDWLNATPKLPELREIIHELPAGEGRWQPFEAPQIAAMRETYSDDLLWLAAGADGLASLITDPNKIRVEMNPPVTDLTRGRHYDHEKRRLAGSG